MAEAPGASYDTEEDQQQDSDSEVEQEENESLKEHVKEFQQKDAILEPAILRTFEDFLDLGGETKGAAKHLSGSYSGLPLMVNTLLDWLHAAAIHPTDPLALVEIFLKSLQATRRCKKKEIQALIEDHLKMLILKHFDPKKADLIFTEEGSTPSWLEDMIGFPTWRELFYQLADQYPECLMLKFTIKLISDAGYQGEITSVSTASHQPEVFCERLKNLLCQVITTPPAELQDSFTALCQLVCHSQHTYFYSQALIHALGERNKEQSYFTHWLSEEIQKEARKRILQINNNFLAKIVHVSLKKLSHGSNFDTCLFFRHPLPLYQRPRVIAEDEFAKKLDVTSMTLHFNGVGSHSRVFEALGSMLSRNALNPADVSILYRCYAEENKAPPVRFLWNAQFFELLMQTLFKPGSAVNPEHKDKYLYLLAYASSVYENADEEVVIDELAGTKEAIETAYSICCSAYDSQAELLTRIATLFECIRYPVVSMCVLHWVEAILTEASFFEVSAESSSLFLVLLDEMSSCHPLQHPFVLDLIHQLLEGSYPMLEEHVQYELKRSLVDHLVHLLSCGHVIPVISYIHKCSLTGVLDHSLLRHFISEVLGIVEPPYSQEFTGVFLPLLNNEEITTPLLTPTRDDLVSLFLAECPRRSKKKKKTKNHSSHNYNDH